MEQSGEVFFVSRPVCVAIYSILHVRQSIQPLAEHMGVTTLCRALHESNSEASLVTEKTKETLMENAVDNMNAKLEEIFFSVARRVSMNTIRACNNESWVFLIASDRLVTNRKSENPFPNNVDVTLC